MNKLQSHSPAGKSRCFYFTLRKVLHPVSEICKNIHIVNIGVIRRSVMVEILVYHAVGKPLRAHIIEVVRGLEQRPILLQVLVLDAVHLGREVVQSTESVVLQRIAEPGGQVALLVAP